MTDSSAAARVQAPDPAPVPARVGLAVPVLAVLALAWLAAMLWSAYATIRTAPDAVTTVIDAAWALPGVIAAGVLAGAAGAGAALAVLLARRGGTGVAGRLAVATGTGFGTGAVAATLVLLGYGHRGSIVVLAATVALAGTVGGAAVAVPRPEFTAATVAATLSAFVLDLALTVFQSPLLRLFGAGGSARATYLAGGRLALAASLLGGVAGGLVAYLWLRRGRYGRRFPAYLAAGAAPGVVLLLAELVTRLGGGQLYGLAGRLGGADAQLLDLMGTSRLEHALIVLFAGTLTALFVFGRTLPVRPGTGQPAGRRDAQGTQVPSSR